MATQHVSKGVMIRWKTLKGLAAIILFLILAVLAEYLVVLYAMNRGAKDTAPLETDWPTAITISPLFELVPITGVITLAFSWTYLTKKLAVKPQEIRKGKAPAYAKRGVEPKKVTSKIGRSVRNFFGKIKSGLLKLRGISYLWRKINFARPTVRSALTVLLAFLALVLVASLLTYPQLIYRTVAGAYQNNPSLLNFVQSVDNSTRAFAQTVAPIGWIGTGINDVLIAVAPGVRDAGQGLGSLLRPLAGLDDNGKYLVFQNVAVWVSGLLILFYGEYMLKGYRYRKK